MTDREIYQKRDLILTEIHSDLKYLRKWCDDHQESDDKMHEQNLKKFEKIDSTQVFYSRIIYGALGIIAFLQFIGYFHK